MWTQRQPELLKDHKHRAATQQSAEKELCHHPGQNLKLTRKKNKLQFSGLQNVTLIIVTLNPDLL